MKKHRIFRCLDKPSSFFGVKGRFGKWGAIILLIAGVISVIIGSVTNTLFGLLTFMILFVIVYISILGIQKSVTDRQMSKIFAARSRVTIVKARPEAIRSLFQFYS